MNDFIYTYPYYVVYRVRNRYGKRERWRKEVSMYMSIEEHAADGTASLNGD